MEEMGMNQPSEQQRQYEQWRHWINGISYYGAEGQEPGTPEQGSDLYVITYQPRFKFFGFCFRPPMRKPWLWAYKVTQARKFTNVYPTSMKSGPDVQDIDFTFTAQKQEVPPEVEERAQQVLKFMKDTEE